MAPKKQLPFLVGKRWQSEAYYIAQHALRGLSEATAKRAWNSYLSDPDVQKQVKDGVMQQLLPDEYKDDVPDQEYLKQ